MYSGISLNTWGIGLLCPEAASVPAADFASVAGEPPTTPSTSIAQAPVAAKVDNQRFDTLLLLSDFAIV